MSVFKPIKHFSHQVAALPLLLSLGPWTSQLLATGKQNVELEMIDQIDSVSLKSILNNKLKDKMLVHAL